MTKFVLAVAVVIALSILVAACTQQPPQAQQQSATEQRQQGQVPTDQAGQQEEQQQEEQPQQASERLIDVTDDSFSPKTLTIKVGDTVKWVNKGTKEMWPASAIHPIHEVYPEKGSCFAGKFDASCQIAPGSSWSFTFSQKGTWNYHDHLNPSAYGKIIVE